MRYTSVFSETALNELSEFWLWYEYKVFGLGDRFKEAVFNKLNEIEIDPTKELQRKYPYREAIVKVFPYLIVYRIDEENKQIFIQSIFHTRRNPRKKYRK